MMIHLVVNLYLVAFQLVQMAQSFKRENLEEELLVRGCTTNLSFF